MSKSFIDLTKDPNNTEFVNTRRAWVNLVANPDDLQVRLAMNAAAIDLAKKIATNPANVVIESQVNDPLGSTHHEAGTLWVGSAEVPSRTRTASFIILLTPMLLVPRCFPGSALPTHR